MRSTLPKRDMSIRVAQYIDLKRLFKHTFISIPGVNALAGAAANFTADCLLDATWHLGAGSMCIDAGTAAGAPATDFDGEARPFGLAHDVGADELTP